MKTKTYSYWATDNSFYQWDKSIFQEKMDLEDWLSLNADLSLVHIDSKYAQIYESKRIRFGDFKLYEIRNLSPVRNNSLRFLMNDSQTNLYVLDSTNGPIYNLWDILVKTFSQNAAILFNQHASKKIDLVLQDYIKFFFNNVAGKHGLFHMVESVEDVKNRANNFHFLNPEDNNISRYTAGEWEPALVECMRLYRQPQIIENPLNESLGDKQPTSSSGFKLLNMLMVFRSSLFKANIFISTDEKSYGRVALSQECVAVLESYDEKKELFKVVFVDVDPEENGAYLPVFPI